MSEASEASAAIESIDELIAYFRAAEKPVEQWRIGTEHEKVGLFRDTLERVPYEGERGIGALLDRIASSEAGWERVYEGANLIALAKDGASITLEPGGQIELSGAPLHTLRETCREFNAHVDTLKDISDAMGIDWLSLGMDPCLLYTSPSPRDPE